MRTTSSLTALTAVAATSLLVGLALERAATARQPQAQTRATPKPASPVRSGPGPKGIVTHVRPVLSHTNLKDGIWILVHWGRSTGYLQRNDPLASEEVDWKKTVSTFRIHLETPRGKSMTLEPGTISAHLGSSSLYSTSTLMLGVDSKGLRHGATSTPWKSPLPQALTIPGRYILWIEGALVLKKRRIAFATGRFPLVIVRHSASFLPLKKLEKLANRAVHRYLKRIPKEVGKKHGIQLGRTIDDEKGTRLVRFRVASTRIWSYLSVEVAMRPSGKVLGFRHQTIFTCVAHGTRIAVPSPKRAGSGSGVAHRPVQDLKPGDKVWAFDPAGKTRVLASVERIVRHVASNLVSINQRLRLTATHPILLNGRWAAAALARRGDRLVTLSGIPSRVDRVRTLHPTSGFTPVYDLMVGWPHNYYAEGVLVHNKRVRWDPSRHDIWSSMWRRPVSLGTKP